MKRVIILQIVLLAGVAAAATDPNLVGWWTFDEGTGTVAYDSAGTNNGTIYGATWTTGKIAGALSFDGTNDYINCGSGPSNYDNITVSVWMKSSTQGTLVSNRGSSSGYGMWYTLYSNIIEIGDNSQGGYRNVTFNTPTLDSAWHHIVYTKDGINHAIYVDGSLDQSFTSNADISQNAPLFIGKRWTISVTPPIWLNGVTDDVRIYNRALSAEEVQQLYEGTTPVLTGLEITGPNEVAENSAASYRAIAHYDNGTTSDVTALAEWRAEPNTVATIEAGQLTTGQVLYPRHNIRVHARYTEEQTTVDANLPVSVLAICPQGNALRFDGVNDYVKVNDSSILDITSAITIAAWIKPSDLSEAYLIVTKQPSGTAGSNYPGNYEFRVKSSPGLLDFLHQTSSGTAHSLYTSSSGVTTVGVWHHVAVTLGNGYVNFYIDGAPAGIVAQSGTFGIVNNEPVRIGTRKDCPSYFSGSMDEVRIYNRALSAGEISTIMYSQATSSDPNLVAYWDLDEGTGQTAADVSGHGNNGTLGSSAGIDTADPCWVESDAPGQCTTEQVMLRNLLGATDDKEAANQLIANAKAKERASVQLITILQNQMNRRERANASLAKAQINLAIMQEEMISRQIDATIRRLESALRLLDYEVDPNGRPPAWRPLWNPWPGVNNGGNR